MSQSHKNTHVLVCLRHYIKKKKRRGIDSVPAFIINCTGTVSHPLQTAPSPVAVSEQRRLSSVRLSPSEKWSQRPLSAENSRNNLHGLRNRNTRQAQPSPLLHFFGQRYVDSLTAEGREGTSFIWFSCKHNWELLSKQKNLPSHMLWVSTSWTVAVTWDQLSLSSSHLTQ